MQNRKLKAGFAASIAPAIGLAVLVIIYVVVGIVRDCNIPYGFKTILDQSIVVALVATGAVFIYSLGAFDISLGAATGVTAILGAMAYLASGNLWMMVLTCIAVAIAIGLLNSVLASVFNLPVFVTTIAMLSVLNALKLFLIGVNGTGDYVKIKPKVVAHLNQIDVKLMILIGFVLLCLALFHLTGIGRRDKFIGGNPLCAKLTGISLKKYTIISFIVSGMGMGLGAFVSIIYAPTLSQNTGASLGMDVIMAIVFGGMPLSGGAKSKILAAVLGAFAMSFLNQIMAFLNYSIGAGQAIKAIVFLLIVWIASHNYRGRLLPR